MTLLGKNSQVLMCILTMQST